MMYILIELIIALFLMPFVINWEDWGWRACIIYVGCCIMFTPIVGIPVYKFAFR